MYDNEDKKYRAQAQFSLDSNYMVKGVSWMVRNCIVSESNEITTNQNFIACVLSQKDDDEEIDCVQVFKHKEHLWRKSSTIHFDGPVLGLHWTAVGGVLAVQSVKDGISLFQCMENGNMAQIEQYDRFLAEIAELRLVSRVMLLFPEMSILKQVFLNL